MTSTPAPSDPSPGGPATATDPPGVDDAPTGRRRRRARRADRARGLHGRRRPTRRVLLVALVVVVLVAAGLGTWAGLRLSAPEPRAAVAVTARPVAVPGLPPSYTWLAGGEGAVAIPELGYLAASPDQASVPVASITKIMTAYLVLRDHPLTAGADGPSVTMTAADAASYQTDIVEDQESIELQAGEVLTERQLLQGMLVWSANDFAVALARWDAGSEAAFVTEMNTTARHLGMTATSYADPSGYLAASRSTPADQLRLVGRAMAMPTFAQIVDTTLVTLPLAGTISSVTPDIGTGTVVGVKSGFTTAAGGCDVLAQVRSIGGTEEDGVAVGAVPAVVDAAVTGERTGAVLDEAASQAMDQAQVAAAAVTHVTVARAGEVVGRVRTPMGNVPAVLTRRARFLGVPGQQVAARFTAARRPRAGDRAGTVLGTMTFRLGSERARVPVVLARRLPEEGLGARLGA